MKLRSFLIASLLLLIFAFSSNYALANGETEQNGQGSELISCGRIVYSNGTTNDTTDDIIIYDSDDLRNLELKIRAIEYQLSMAKENLK